MPTLITDFATVTNARRTSLTNLTISFKGTLPDQSLAVAGSLDMPDSLAAGHSTVLSVTFTPAQVHLLLKPCRISQHRIVCPVPMCSIQWRRRCTG